MDFVCKYLLGVFRVQGTQAHKVPCLVISFDRRFNQKKSGR